MKKLLLITIVAMFSCNKDKDSAQNRKSSPISYNYYDSWVDKDSTKHTWTPTPAEGGLGCECNQWDDWSGWYIVPDSECDKPSPCDD